MNKILIVDDDKDIRYMLELFLRKEGFETETANNGLEAVEKIKNNSVYSLIIMDIMMPEMDGIDATMEIRRYTNCPVLYLTARSQELDKIMAYESGGDDYLVKPFSSMELILRIRAILKRTEHHVETGMKIDPLKRCCYIDGKKVDLTGIEFDILYLLYSERGKIFEVNEIYEKIWKEPVMHSSSNTVMVHILKLRKKIEEDYKKPKLIKTVWGRGYCYEEASL